jgi:hypothetical protein
VAYVVIAIVAVIVLVGLVLVGAMWLGSSSVQIRGSLTKLFSFEISLNKGPAPNSGQLPPSPEAVASVQRGRHRRMGPGLAQGRGRELG